MKNKRWLKLHTLFYSSSKIKIRFLSTILNTLYLRRKKRRIFIEDRNRTHSSFIQSVYTFLYLLLLSIHQTDFLQECIHWMFDRKKERLSASHLQCFNLQMCFAKRTCTCICVLYVLVRLYIRQTILNGMCTRRCYGLYCCCCLYLFPLYCLPVCVMYTFNCTEYIIIIILQNRDYRATLDSIYVIHWARHTLFIGSLVVRI